MRFRLSGVLWTLLLVSTLAVGQETANSRHFLTSDGVRLHYLEAGQKDAALLVFVPGWTMPAWIWERQMAHFSRSHRVIALDPRSQGESGKPAEGHTPARRARDIKELVDHLGGGPAVLVGWSLGVPELIKYVDLFGSEGVRALVLVDGMLPDPENPNPPDATRGMFQWLLQMQNDRRKFTEGFVRSMYKKPQRDAYLRRVTEAALKTPTNSAVVLLANMVTYGDWRPMVKKIGVPVLYVYQPQLQSSAERLQKEMPGVRLERFEEAGHALFVDEAERFNRMVEEFVARASTPDAPAARSRVYKVGRDSGIEPPKIISTVDPQYSREALSDRIHGTVELSAVVDENGKVREVNVIRPLGYGLDEEAVRALRRWRFRPGTKDGRTVPVEITVVINFRM